VSSSALDALKRYIKDQYDETDIDMSDDFGSMYVSFNAAGSIGSDYYLLDGSSRLTSNLNGCRSVKLEILSLHDVFLSLLLGDQSDLI